MVLPQLLSRLLTSLRLLLGSAWLFLISAEAISATAGLGYRIFLVRRYMAMDVIIPYVIWITLLAWLMDLGLRQLHKVCLPVGRRRPDMSFIRINNIWQEYGDHVVLERINLAVKEGEFCSMVGASGCGKSTFLRLLLGQEKPTRGTITLDGQPLAPEPDRSRGVVFQRYSVFPHLSVLDNVTVGLELPSSPCFGRLFGARKRAAREQAAQMLDKVGLAHALDRYPAQLSRRDAAAAGDRPGLCDAAAGSAARRAFRRARPGYPQRYARPAASAMERNANDGLYGHPRFGRRIQPRQPVLLVFDKVRHDRRPPTPMRAPLPTIFRLMRPGCRRCSAPAPITMSMP